MAGTGKTTIAKSFAVEMESKGYLGASFFIRHTHEPTRNPRHIVQTLAFDLANLDYRRMESLWNILRNEPNIVTMSLEKQIHWLIRKPFESNPPDEALVIVIDALDEAMRPETRDPDRDIRYAGADLIVKLASALSGYSIRLLFTSRHEPEIARELSSVKHSLLDLQDHQHNVASHDLKLYYETHFDKINNRLEISINWRSYVTWAVLLRRTGTLFIYAATIVRIIQSSTKSNPFKKLQSLLDTDVGIYGSQSASALLSDLYRGILEDAVKDRFGQVQHDVASSIERALQYMIYSYQPLSVNAMLELLDLDDIDGEDLWDDLQGLSSAIILPDRNTLDGLIFPLHESFADFLRSCKIDQPFKLPWDRHLSHDRLAEACLKVILSTARKSNRDIADSSLGFNYAVTAWPHHWLAANHTCQMAFALLAKSVPTHAKLEITFPHDCNKEGFSCGFVLSCVLKDLWVNNIFIVVALLQSI
jgi:hypothetical protein